MLSLAAVYVAVSSGATGHPRSTTAYTFLCPPRSLAQPQGPRGTAPTLDTTKAALTHSGCFVCRAGNGCPHPGLLCLASAGELMHSRVQGLWLPSLLLGYHFLAAHVAQLPFSLFQCVTMSHCLPKPWVFSEVILLRTHPDALLLWGLSQSLGSKGVGGIIAFYSFEAPCVGPRFLGIPGLCSNYEFHSQLQPCILSRVVACM